MGNAWPSLWDDASFLSGFLSKSWIRPCDFARYQIDIGNMISLLQSQRCYTSIIHIDIEVLRNLMFGVHYSFEFAECIPGHPERSVCAVLGEP